MSLVDQCRPGTQELRSRIVTAPNGMNLDSLYSAEAAGYTGYPRA